MTCEAGIDQAIRGHGLEYCILFTPVLKIHPRHRAAAMVQSVFVEDDETIGLRIRERLQQHRIDHAENRGVGAYPQRQRQESDRGESWFPSQNSKALFEVVGQILEDRTHWPVPLEADRRTLRRPSPA